MVDINKKMCILESAFFARSLPHESIEYIFQCFLLHFCLFTTAAGSFFVFSNFLLY